MLNRLAGVLLVIGLLWNSGAQRVAVGQGDTQSSTGAICVATFADLNANGQREPDETALAGINVNLLTGGVIIATHVTAMDEDRYCFENLLPGSYRVVFTDSPTYRATTGSQASHALDAGETFTLDIFGAFPVPLDGLRAEVAAQIAATKKPDEPFAPSTRLFLATAGAMMVMVFMIGLGAILLGIISSRQRARKRAPSSQPPLPPPGRLTPPGAGGGPGKSW